MTNTRRLRRTILQFAHRVLTEAATFINLDHNLAVHIQVLFELRIPNLNINFHQLRF